MNILYYFSRNVSRISQDSPKWGPPTCFSFTCKILIMLLLYSIFHSADIPFASKAIMMFLLWWKEIDLIAVGFFHQENHVSHFKEKANFV